MCSALHTYNLPAGSCHSHIAIPILCWTKESESFALSTWGKVSSLFRLPSSAVYYCCDSLWGSHMIHYAQKLQNWQALRNWQEETLRVAHNFSCHCSLLDEHLSAAYKWAQYNHSAKNTAIFILVFLCTARELFISLLAWLCWISSTWPIFV